MAVAIAVAKGTAELLETGTLQPVRTVAHKRTGKRPAPSTVWRWCRSGIQGGLKLAAVFHSGVWHTTDAAFDAFLEAQTQAQLAREFQPVGVSDDALSAAGLL